jgi:hypothetical protein
MLLAVLSSLCTSSWRKRPSMATSSSRGK